MKKNLLSIIGIAASFGAFAQLPVSTQAENKNAILEEFTGIACTFCPQGHAIGNQLAADNPGDVVLINIHTGGYANPQGAGTDFRTSFGAAIAGQTNLAGYPAGTVNRHAFPGINQNGSGTAQSRGTWAQTANTILGEVSYANVALEGTVDFTSREMTVDVEVHFTGTAPASVNLNVALMQNNVEGPQTGAAGNPDGVLANGNYNHGHMLRHLLTGQWGEVISTTTQGTTYSGTFTYTVPADINGVDMNIEDLEIAAFIAEGQQEIITGAKGPITFLNAPNQNDVTLARLDPTSPCDLSLEPEIVVNNNGGNNITSMTIVYNLGGQNMTYYNWTGTLYGYNTQYITLPAIAVPTDIGTSLTVKILDINGGSDTNPSDNEMNAPVAVVSGTDFTFEFSQDRDGNENTWEIIEDASGAVLYSGGPYAILTSNTTVLHTIPVNLPNSGCYRVKVLDNYGDGMNHVRGEGKFELKDGNNVVLAAHDGKFSDSTELHFNILSSSPLAVNDEEIDAELTIYPNPVSNMANIQFYLTDVSNANLTIHNILGEVVYTSTNLNQGQNIINFNVAELGSGMYFATIKNEKGMTSAKFTVAK